MCPTRNLKWKRYETLEGFSGIYESQRVQNFRCMRIQDLGCITNLGQLQNWTPHLIVAICCHHIPITLKCRSTRAVSGSIPAGTRQESNRESDRRDCRDLPFSKQKRTSPASLDKFHNLTLWWLEKRGIVPEMVDIILVKKNDDW
jgi:hypothetical protein